MDGRARASLLWGLVGVLSFLVLVQGYDLLAQTGVGLAAKGGVALVVGVATTGLAYAAESRLGARAR